MRLPINNETSGIEIDIDTRSQLTGTSHFSNDLGLDSLDTVEVVMAIEEVRCVVQVPKLEINESIRNSALRFLTRRRMVS